MRLLLIRHGETSWNKEEIFRGQLEVPLNETGIDQAKHIAKLLQKAPIDAVYSSPLGRALETARLIAEPHGLAVITAPGLTDLDYGAWQGLSHQEVKERYPELYQVWLTAPYKLRFEHGESLDDVRNRALDTVNRLSVQHRDHNVVAVSHRVVIKLLVCAILGLGASGFWAIRQDTCAVNTIEHDEQHGFMIYGLNDTCHIRPLTAHFSKSRQAADF
jgi:broad specificity phosphatase PhoE